MAREPILDGAVINDAKDGPVYQSFLNLIPVAFLTLPRAPAAPESLPAAELPVATTAER